MRLYHISAKKLKGLKFKPRVPKSKTEEQDTPRICVSPTIQGCLIGLNEERDLTDETFYVYYVDEDDYENVSKEQVPDSHVTNEKWITHPIELKFYGTIKIINKKDSKKEKILGHYYIVPIWNYKLAKELKWCKK